MDVQLVQEVAVKVLLLNMKTLLFYIIFFLSCAVFSQESLSELLKKYNTEEVSYAWVENLQESSSETIFLDAREPEEFNVSHLKNAICVGYNDFSIEQVEKKIPNKDQHIIVYCSLGVRSEIIAQKIIDAGYTNVKNLYGGIFEWKNKDFEVFNLNQQKTDSIHAYSKAWSKWLKKGVKVYE